MSPEPSTADTLEAANDLLIPTYGPLPIVPSHGHGSTVYDTDGRSYIDLGAGIAVTSLGHCSPILTEVLQQQASQLWHVSNIFTNEPAIALATKLIDATFADRVFFANSGGEANEAALKLARRYAYNKGKTDKYEIVALNGAFHGRTLFTVSVGGTPAYKEGFGPPLEGIIHIDRNDIEALRAAVSERTCAIMLEPIQGESGIQPLDVEFLQAARDLCDEYDALLIFDEVQTGVGRTGSLYAYQGLGITPDVLTTAKGLGGGFPVAATLASGEAAEALTKGTHGTTYGGNPLACAIASAVLDEVVKPAITENVAARHGQIVAHLERIAEATGLFSDIRAFGLLVGAEMASDYQGRAKEVQVAALAEGVITLIAGANVLRIAPALNITEAEVDAGFERLARAAAKVTAAAN